jgi:biopolymer transport protein ExbD
MAMGKVPGGSSDDPASEDGMFAEINITPLTDIFLVLLIIFMVTSSVIVNQGTGAKAVQAQTNDLSVAILADGRLVVGGDVVSADELKKAFADAKAMSPDTLVIVQADEGVPHGKVVEVMEAAKAAGLAQLAIGVREGPAK